MITGHLSGFQGSKVSPKEGNLIRLQFLEHKVWASTLFETGLGFDVLRIRSEPRLNFETGFQNTQNKHFETPEKAFLVPGRSIASDNWFHESQESGFNDRNVEAQK